MSGPAPGSGTGRGTTAELGRVIFSPGSVAIVGASDQLGKTTARPATYLRRAHWPGSMYLVNSRRRTVLGERAWPSVGALPEVPEHVFVLTGPDDAIETAAACGHLGVPVASLIADGFTGDGEEAATRRTRLREIVQSTGIRVIGPGSLGVVNLHEDLRLTANAVFAQPDLPRGGTFVASQSGSVIGALASRGREMGVGFAAMVATGSELDLSLGELCLTMLDDPRIDRYALFLESLERADTLAVFARAAAERGKPVLAYKLGRSAEAAALSVSHTGALAGDDDMASLLLEDLGIGRVSIFEALLEALPLVSRVPLRPRAVRRPRVAVLSTTGGGGAMLVDCLATRGAQVSGPTAETRDKLRAAGIDAGPGVLVDLTLAGTRYEVMRSCLDILGRAPEFDLVVAVPGSSAQFHPEQTVEPIVDAGACGTPLAAFVVPEAPGALRLLRAGGVAAFRTPEACADGVLAAFARQMPRGRPVGGGEPSGGRVLNEASSYGWFDSVGLPHAPFAVLPVAEIPDVVGLTGPLVVKALADALPHKSEAGGVVVGVETAVELRAAAEAIQRNVYARAGVQVDHVLVQQVTHGLGEVLIGFVRDRTAGPVVIVAAGGVLAEIYRDRSVRPAPVDRETAREMIGEVRSLKALSGFRGAPRGDLGALAAAIVAISRLACLDDAYILEAEVNPLIVRAEGHGALAVDALVRLGTGTEGPRHG